MPLGKVSADNRYAVILEDIFRRYYKNGATSVDFERDDIVRAAKRRKVELPKNLGDLIYSFRYRSDLPEFILRKAPRGKTWVIRPVGRALYRFAAVSSSNASILPNDNLVETKIPDATPNIISRYALNDEQALLAIVRYNRLVDVFSGVSCYSLQSHLRSAVPGMGQVETDEIYVGVDKRGAHYVFPVQAKGGRDNISVVQIEQDFALCREKFPHAICRPIGAQFMANDLIALFEFVESRKTVKMLSERHYKLVPNDDLSEAETTAYAERAD